MRELAISILLVLAQSSIVYGGLIGPFGNIENAQRYGPYNPNGGSPPGQPTIPAGGNSGASASLPTDFPTAPGIPPERPQAETSAILPINGGGAGYGGGPPTIAIPGNSGASTSAASAPIPTDLVSSVASMITSKGYSGIISSVSAAVPGAILSVGGSDGASTSEDTTSTVKIQLSSTVYVTVTIHPSLAPIPVTTITNVITITAPADFSTTVSVDVKGASTPSTSLNEGAGNGGYGSQYSPQPPPPPTPAAPVRGGNSGAGFPAQIQGGDSGFFGGHSGSDSGSGSDDDGFWGPGGFWGSNNNGHNHGSGGSGTRSGSSGSSSGYGYDHYKEKRDLPSSASLGDILKQCEKYTADPNVKPLLDSACSILKDAAAKGNTPAAKLQALQAVIAYAISLAQKGGSFADMFHFPTKRAYGPSQGSGSSSASSSSGSNTGNGAGIPKLPVDGGSGYSSGSSIPKPSGSGSSGSTSGGLLGGLTGGLTGSLTGGGSPLGGLTGGLSGGNLPLGSLTGGLGGGVASLGGLAGGLTGGSSPLGGLTGGLGGGSAPLGGLTEGSSGSSSSESPDSGYNPLSGSSGSTGSSLGESYGGKGY